MPLRSDPIKYESDKAAGAIVIHRYKDLEPDEWVELNGWGEPEEAHRLIPGAMRRG